MKTPILRRAAASTLLAAAALIGHAGASAAVVQYDFSTTIDFSTGTPAVGSVATGSFSFDNTVGGLGSYVLATFSFLFEGVTYELDDLASADVAFNGSTLLGLDASSSSVNSSGASLFAFVSGTADTSDASFLFDFGAPARASGAGNFTATRVGGNTVPEPGTLLLVAGLLPLIGIGAARRQRDAG